MGNERRQIIPSMRRKGAMAYMSDRMLKRGIVPEQTGWTPDMGRTIELFPALPGQEAYLPAEDEGMWEDYSHLMGGQMTQQAPFLATQPMQQNASAGAFDFCTNFGDFPCLGGTGSSSSSSSSFAMGSSLPPAPTAAPPAPP